MNSALLIVLWTGIVGVSILPALSNAGYLPINIEYILAVLLSVILGLFFVFIGRIRYVNVLLLLMLAAFPVALYFGNFLLESDWLLGGAALFAVALAIFAYRRYDKALILVGVVAFSQIITVAVATPSYIMSLKEYPVTRSNLPSIIHLILDEHGGMPAVPAKAVPLDKLKAFQDDYVKQGFIVFSHAYTADTLTHKSLPRLFNVNQSNKKGKLVRNGSGGFRNDNSQKTQILQSSVFDKISKDRVLDITQINYVNFDIALAKNLAVARNLTYNVRAISGIINTLSLKDRLILAKSLLVEWFLKGLHSPTAKWLFSTLQIRKNVPAAHGIVSQMVMHQLSNRLASYGQRGTYYFAHLLLPHKPYIFDENCNLLPINQWGRRSYPKYFGQINCAKREVFYLTEQIMRNEKMIDSIILVHGDHGAKVNNHSEQDKRGTFLAIKIPGIEGMIIDTPVRLDTFYANLLANNFEVFEPDKLTPLDDSPY